MKISDPTINALATAKSVLLDPWGLSETDMTRALGEICAHKVDYADLYFQYTRAEGWSLEEGIVKTGSFSISQGVGVRAVSAAKTAFAYSDALSAAALLASARAVRSIARRSEEHTSELQSQMRISYAVFCLKQQKLLLVT